MKIKAKHSKYVSYGILCYVFVIFDTFARLTFGKGSLLSAEPMN
jgi:hypothetical protein